MAIVERIDLEHDENFSIFLDNTLYGFTNEFSFLGLTDSTLFDYVDLFHAEEYRFRMESRRRNLSRFLMIYCCIRGKRVENNSRL